MLERRQFLSLLPAATVALGAGILTAPSVTAAGQYAGVGAIETLMRGHGLLLRALNVYDSVRDRIAKGQETEPSAILKIAEVFRNYLEGFHEQMEERYIFAPLEKANNNFDSIQELKVQHGTGYELTRRISDRAKSGKLDAQLGNYLLAFGRMYAHHAAWEDTVIFPAFDSMEKRSELEELVGTFKLEEEKALGPTGFDSFVNEVAEVEKQLGTFKLSVWTPAL